MLLLSFLLFPVLSFWLGYFDRCLNVFVAVYIFNLDNFL